MSILLSMNYETAQHLINQGKEKKALNRDDQAIQKYDEVLSLLEKEVTSDAWSLKAESYLDLAVLFRNKGKYKLTTRYLEQAANAFEKVHGTMNNTDSAGCFYQIGQVYDSLHRPKQARIWYEKSYNALLNCLGAEHPTTKKVEALVRSENT